MDEDVVILRVDTSDAVKTVGTLREEIKAYRSQLNDAEIGSDNYKKALKGLTDTQLELKAAMNASTQSTEELMKSTQELDGSYNSLVNQMAALKKAWRSTTDEATRANLGAEILKINTRLKELDASTGNFQRSVGDYARGVKEGLDAFTKGVGNAIPGLQSLNAVADGFAKNPFIAVVGLLVGLFAKIIARMKETEEGQAAINKLMSAVGKILEPINNLIAWISGLLADLFDWLGGALQGVTKFLNKIVGALGGVGNAILQYILAPIRSAIAVIKGVAAIIGDIFKGKWGKVKEDAKAIGQGVGDAWKKGFSVKANFKAGKDATDTFLAGIASKKKDAKKTGKEIGKALAEGIEEEIVDGTQDALDALAESQAADKAQSEATKKLFDWLNKRRKMKEDAAQKDAEWSAAARAKEDAEAEEQAEKRAENIKKTWETSVSAVADVLGSLADIYEANTDGSARSEKRIKALRIASATIQTIQGAVGAYMQSVASIPPPAGIIVGAANAATVTAAGLANIAKMRSTSLEGGGTTGISTPAARVAATIPVQAAASPSTMATLASDTRMLNAMDDIQVYILSSDIEKRHNAKRVQVAETTF